MEGEDEEEGYFGQEQVPLSDEIREILEEYPDGQIFKEILQNADDAKATEVKFFIDERSHGQRNLLHPSLAKFQGPALLTYNNAVFTDEDWTNIQKLKRSNKRSDPFKVGKFGIGFNSVFHVTDIPAIISGKWLCFMDPQKTMWRGDPGRKYKLTNNTQQNSDSFSPFKFMDDCSLGAQQQYNGTIIRFPLRNEPSGLSNKLYTVAKLKELLKALKDDAAVLLLFLRYVERIEVFTINASSLVSKIFCVETEKNQGRQLKASFLSGVEKYYSDYSSSLPRLKYEATITVHDVQIGTKSDYQWIIMHWVGSRDRDVMNASSQVCSLPWIGLAVPLTLQCPSRLFCFLPLPDSKEVNPPLPFCVHGTFGLNKDRRHLKWITPDMKNDDGALWNELHLLFKMLPSCYAECLNILKAICKPELYYSFWPQPSVINKTNWKIILKPLLPLLLQGQYIWSENGRWIVLDLSVCVVPQINSSQFPKVAVIDVLIRCGKTVAVLPENVWDTVKFIYRSSYPFTTITPSVVRQSIRTNSQSYTNLSKADKFQLLHYCLGDRNYYDLNGLILLPTVVNTFVEFDNNQSGVKMHVCDKQFLSTKLLDNTLSTFVSVEGEDASLHHKLRELAISRCTQLQILTPESVAVLLKQTSPFQNGWSCYGSAGGFYNENWLKTFWSWVAVHSLSYFVSIPLVPVCGGKNHNSFKVVSLAHRYYTCTYVYNRSESLFYSVLVTGAEKLGCHLTCSDDFPFLDHSELSNYVPQLSPSALLSIAAQMNYQNVVFMQEEANALKYFLFQYPSSVSWNTGQKLVATKLNIFTVLQTNSLTSLRNATSSVGGNSAAAMLVSEPDIISKYTFCLLPSPMIITCEQEIVKNLQASLPGTCWVPTKLQLITDVILLAIENKQLSRNQILKVTSTLLDPSEYYSFTNASGSEALVNKLRLLKYVATSEDGDLFSPCEVYDPMDHVLKELFEGQSVFPIAPFSSVHFSVLKQLGMKDFNTLSPSDIIRVTDIICNQTDTQVKVKQAYNLLAFLSSTGNRLLNEYYNNRPLDQTIRSLQWLPVITTPPEGYPKCLGWKGSSGSQFVSAQSLHASSSPEEHKELPNIVGSQMKLILYVGPLSAKLVASLNIPQSVPVDAMVLQLFNLINHKTEIEIAKFKFILAQLYAYLQKAVQNNASSQYWQQLRQSEVVQVSDNKFVLPSLVACSFDEKCMTIGKLEPYWYILPSDLQQYRSLFCFIGAKDKVTVSDVFFVLETMSCNPNSNISCQQQLEVVNKIVKWLCDFTESETERIYDKIFVPISSDDKNTLVLKPARQVAFLGSGWVGDDRDDLGDILENYFLVHPSISYDMACKLQLKPLYTITANSKKFCFEQDDQSKPLTTHLKREYKDTRVIQEEEISKISGYQMKINQLEVELSDLTSKLAVCEKNYVNVKTDNRKLMDKIYELKKLEFGDSLIINSKDVHITPKILGYSSYSVVYAAQYYGKQCVVKQIDSTKEKSYKSLNKELKVLRTLKHPCVIQLLGVFFKSDDLKSPVLLMERMKVNLTNFLNDERSFHHKVSILNDVACGLCYIHKKGIIHCDLTGNNILLTENFNAKIADFGQAIIYDQECDRGLPTAPGNEAHMPPEAFKPNPDYSTKLDVFSFGCVIIHTVTQEFPIPDNKYVETSEQGNYKELSEVDRRSKLINTLKRNRDGNTILYDMVLECLQDDPLSRPVIEGVCEHLTEVNRSLKLATHSKLLTNNAGEIADKPNAATEPGLQQGKQPLQWISMSKKFSHVSHSITTLTSRKQVVNIPCLLIEQLSLLKTLNLSGLDITDQGAYLIATVLCQTISLEVLDASYTKMNTVKCVKISETLKHISSLQCLKMSNNAINEDAAGYLSAAVSNCLIEELDLSNNQLSSLAMFEIITALSKSETIRVLDISKNFISVNNIGNISTVLSKCLTLQELNLSQNLLMLTGVVRVAQALRGHPNLKHLNVEKNLISYFSECEFLVDIILSTNQSLLYLNVCGRNIRPRFVEDHMTPPCSHEKCNNFVIQNLYLPDLLLSHVLTSVHYPNKAANTPQGNVVRVTESCPITGEDISSYYVDHIGGTFYNTAHNFAIIIPPGAVLQGECVQIQATASRFGPYQLPDGYYPISSFFWVSAHYTFKIPVYLILSHHASPRNVSDLYKLYVLEACVQNVCTTSEGKLLMNKLLHGVFFDDKIGYCTISTNHFCSQCLAKDDINVPDKFLASYFAYGSSGLLNAEVCMCHVNKECIEEVEKQYKIKETKLLRPVIFSFSSQQSLTIKVDPEQLQGWDITIQTEEICHDEFDFRHYEMNTLQKLENICGFPPRFVVTYQRNIPYVPLSSKLIISNGVKQMKFQISDGSEPIQALNETIVGAPAHHSPLKNRISPTSEPEMADLNRIVIPKIEAEWEDVAFALRYKIPKVMAIKEKHKEDPKKCCRELFINWLSKDYGVSPKNWSTLLEKLREVENLAKVTEEIVEKLHIAI